MTCRNNTKYGLSMKDVAREGGMEKSSRGNGWDENTNIRNRRPVGSPDSSKAFREETWKEKIGDSSYRNEKDIGRFFEDLEENERKHFY